MKTFVLCGIAAMIVAPAFAQSSADPANKTVTLTGCVGSSADASGFTLAEVVVVPGTAAPSQVGTPSALAHPVTPSAPPPSTPPAAGIPPASSAAVPPPATAAAVPPASAAAPPRSTAAPVANPAQTVPPASPAQTVPPASPAAVGTTGAAPGTATSTTGVTGGMPANVPGPGGYRLSGVDMTSWAGQRVQVVGTFSPAAAMPAASTAVGQSGAPSAPPLEFRVQSIQPIAGPCPGK